jgi:hypothetical protein
MKRDLRPEDLNLITQAILGGDRIQAINIYISITENGLTEAYTFLKKFTAEVNSMQQERQTAKQHNRQNLWQRLVFSVKK